jgi:Bacteriophage holin family
VLAHWKTSLYVIGLFLWTALTPAHTALGAIIALPLVDLLMALVCARKALGPIQANPFKEACTWLTLIKSGGIKRTVAKILMYMAAVVLAFFVGAYLAGPLVPCMQGVTGLIGVTELKSCLEHLDELNGAPFFATIINKLTPPGD